jgi:predicted glutamine amidotransferase
LLELAKITRSECILAHIRAATQGFETTVTNCHPFKIGRFVFMHNGDIGGFSKIKRPLNRMLSDERFDLIRGTTDSEHFLALLLDEYYRNGHGSVPVDMLSGMTNAIERIMELRANYDIHSLTNLNTVFTDGEYALVTRFTTGDEKEAASLYINRGNEYRCENGICYMIRKNLQNDATIVSSEPLSEEDSWDEVPVNQILVLHHGKVISKNKIKHLVLK